MIGRGYESERQDDLGEKLSSLNNRAGRGLGEMMGLWLAKLEKTKNKCAFSKKLSLKMIEVLAIMQRIVYNIIMRYCRAFYGILIYRKKRRYRAKSL